MKNNLLLTTALAVLVSSGVANATLWTEGNGDTKWDGVSDNDGNFGKYYHLRGATDTWYADGETFSGGEAKASGAAVNNMSKMVITNSTFSNNHVKGGNTSTSNNKDINTSVDGGGALFVGSASDTTITGSTFDNNSSNWDGGAIATRADWTSTSGENQLKANGEAKLEIKNSTFTNNHADNQGGAMFNTFEQATVDQSTFTGNSAKNGGAITNLAGDQNHAKGLHITKSTFSGNTATEQGGAIFNPYWDSHNSTITVEESDFSDNTAKSGGAIFSRAYSTVKNGTFSNNHATDGNGGAIFSGQAGKIEVENVTFDGNTAKGDGGAISLDGNKGNTFKGKNVFKNNQAANGGALNVAGSGKITLEGETTFENNTLTDGTKNDINFGGSGSIELSEKASLTLDGGITGDQGTLTLKKDSNLNVNSQTEIESKVTTNNSDTANLNVKMAAGDDSFKLSDIFSNSTQGASQLQNKIVVTGGNNLYTYSTTDKDEYVAKEKSASEVASNLGVNGSEAETVLSMMRSGANTEAFAKVQDVLGSMAQDEVVNSEVLSKAADAMVADAAPTVRVRETALSNMIFDTATDAMDDSLQNAAVGQASGDSLLDKAKVWVKGLFNYADKDDTNKSHGFDIDTYGVAFGMDKNVSPSVKLGAGYAYSQSDIDGYTRDTDVDTHTLFAYAKYKPANWYVNTVASYSFSDYKEKKSVLSYSADAKYDVDTFGLQSVYGYELNTNGYDITPEAGLRYLHIAKEGYVDELGTMALSKNTNVLTAIAGVKAAKTFELSNGMNIRPEVRAAVTYDLTSDNNDTRVVLPNGEALKVSGEKFDRFGAEFGAKLATDITSNWEVSAGYEGRFRDDYQDHTGILSAKYKF